MHFAQGSERALLRWKDRTPGHKVELLIKYELAKEKYEACCTASGLLTDHHKSDTVPSVLGFCVCLDNSKIGLTICPSSDTNKSFIAVDGGETGLDSNLSCHSCCQKVRWVTSVKLTH